MIAEDNPTLSAFDQDAWTAKLDYHRREPAQSLDVFRCIRAGSYEVLKGVAESAYARTGTHTENGPMTLGRLLEGYTVHAEQHADQIRAIRDEWQKRYAK